jgi:hypothetical protein
VTLLSFSEVIVKSYVNKIAIEKYEIEYRESRKGIINNKLVEICENTNEEKTAAIAAETLGIVDML